MEDRAGCQWYIINIRIGIIFASVSAYNEGMATIRGGGHCGTPSGACHAPPHCNSRYTMLYLI